MRIGASIRRMFGPFERRVSEAYRSIFLDIDEFVEQVHRWSPSPRSILEVGCGEGAVTERLRYTFSSAQITAIDVSANIGRLYRGPPTDICFAQCDIQDLAASNTAAFDLIVLCDVLHHVPFGSRQELLDGIRTMLASQGSFIFKDWQRSNSLIHWLCYASDRWVTGDRIRYMTRDEMRKQLELTFGTGSLVGETRVGPRWNNLAILVRVTKSTAMTDLEAC